ncbi:MAG: metallophosphoesterase [Colwellia sp.]
MDYFSFADQLLKIKKDEQITIAQISDPHLFECTEQCHHGANVYHNLTKVIESISIKDEIDLIIFTGDLTQDHTENSYQRFVEIFTDIAKKSTNFSLPVFFIPGNHDEDALLKRYLNKVPFYSDKTINWHNWQIQLLNSKSSTPSGLVSDNEILRLKESITQAAHQLLFMHHHPIDVGYFIDKHGLINKERFWQEISLLNIEQNPGVKAIACGHVHGAMDFPAFSQNNSQCTRVLTCPATSIQFDQTKDHVAALPQSGGYRLITLHQSGDIKTKVLYV